MSIDYDHKRNPHTLESPRAAFPIIFSESMPASLLDVGCGTGTWLKAAQEAGVKSMLGIDGIQVPQEDFWVDASLFQQEDLTSQFDLGRKFDAVLCFEVAEHLDEKNAATLIRSLARHSDLVFFSAACPGQPGQHHVNCQWPGYWQELFNREGFACDDAVRWRLWNQKEVQSWYRQNIFRARRDARAGQEPRLNAVVHPDMLQLLNEEACQSWTNEIAKGRLPAGWYFRLPPSVFAGKIRQKLGQ